jgi:hypothetical protein
MEKFKSNIANSSLPVVLSEFLQYVERNATKGPFIEKPIVTAQRFIDTYQSECEAFSLDIVIDAFYQFCGCSSQFAVTEVFRKALLRNSGDANTGQARGPIG